MVRRSRSSSRACDVQPRVTDAPPSKGNHGSRERLPQRTRENDMENNTIVNHDWLQVIADHPDIVEVP